jgi:hypothetical protein
LNAGTGAGEISALRVNVAGIGCSLFWVGPETDESSSRLLYNACNRLRSFTRHSDASEYRMFNAATASVNRLRSEAVFAQEIREFPESYAIIPISDEGSRIQNRRSAYISVDAGETAHLNARL